MQTKTRPSACSLFWVGSAGGRRGSKRVSRLEAGLKRLTTFRAPTATAGVGIFFQQEGDGSVFVKTIVNGGSAEREGSVRSDPLPHVHQPPL